MSGQAAYRCLDVPDTVDWFNAAAYRCLDVPNMVERVDRRNNVPSAGTMSSDRGAIKASFEVQDPPALPSGLTRRLLSDDLTSLDDSRFTLPLERRNVKT
jgi:hypothetical protein